MIDDGTVLIVYRGGWCIFFNRQLEGTQDDALKFLVLGYQIQVVCTDKFGISSCHCAHYIHRRIQPRLNAVLASLSRC